MFFYSRLVTSLFFILFVFIPVAPAQTIYKINRPDKSEISAASPDASIEKDDSLIDSSRAAPFAGEKTADEAVEQTAAPQESYLLKRGTKELQIEYGISPFNPSNFAGPKEFDVYGRDLHLFNIRFARVIGTKKNVSYQYMFGATPLAIFSKNEVVNKDYVSPTATPTVSPTKRETTYGAGFQPVNFKFIFLARKRLKPYAQVGAGVMFTNKAVPVPRSTLFQLTGDFGGGLMYMLTESAPSASATSISHLERQHQRQNQQSGL
jgi:hypothetical protein